MNHQDSTELDALVAAWLDHLCLERGHADNTRTAYARDAEQFLRYLKTALGRPPTIADFAEINSRTFRGFMAARRREGASSRSLARTLSALRAFFRWLETSEHLRNRAILQVGLPKVPRSLPKPLTRHKAKDLMEAHTGTELDTLVDASTWLEERVLRRPLPGRVYRARRGARERTS